MFDPTDKSWWDERDMGTPEDPYNQCPSLDKSDPNYSEYLDIAEKVFSDLARDGESDSAAASLEERGWCFENEDDGVTIHSKAVEDGSGAICFRGSTIVPYTAEMIRIYLVQLDLRKLWDDQFLDAKFHIQVLPSLRVTQYKFSAPWPTSSRDFIILAGEQMREDGTVCFMSKSIERDDLPEESGFVRGELHYSGMTIKPLPNAEDGTPRCEMGYICQVDPKGWIPLMVANMASLNQPLALAKLRDLIGKSLDMFNLMLEKLWAVSEEDFKEPTITRIFADVIKSVGLPMQTLAEPISYVIAGTRKPDRSVEGLMEELGKIESMRRIHNVLRVYAKGGRLVCKKEWEDLLAK